MSLATETIYKKIRRDIVTSKLNPGDRLKINDCAARHGTSATPVREALQKLTNEGLVENKPNSGFTVIRHTLKDLNELLQVRNILELAALSFSANKISEVQLNELEDVHAPFSGCDDESLERYMDENRNFHYLLAKASGNEKLTELIGQILDRLGRFMVMFGEDDKMAKNHQKIINYLRLKDFDGAKNELEQHVNSTKQFVLDAVINVESNNWHIKA